MKKLFFLIVPVIVATIAVSCNSEEENGTLAVIMDNTSIELVKGESFQLNATVVPADDAAAITWFSEDESYVTVDQNGLVTAVAMKKASEDETDDEENSQAVSVYARYEGGAAECEVTVLPLEPSAITIHPSQCSLFLEEQFMFTVGYEPEDADVKDVEWSTSNSFVAVVKDGVVTAKGYGACEIIAKRGRLEAKAYVLVKQ